MPKASVGHKFPYSQQKLRVGAQSTPNIKQKIYSRLYKNNDRTSTPSSVGLEEWQEGKHCDDFFAYT